jgi:hypothetical protein
MMTLFSRTMRISNEEGSVIYLHLVKGKHRIPAGFFCAVFGLRVKI